MFHKDKEKRKGAPRSRSLRLILVLAIGASLLALTLISYRNANQSPSQFRLVTFDIAEARDELALVLTNGRTSVLATQKWSEFQRGQPTLHVIETRTDAALISVDLHPQENALIVGDSENNHMLYRDDGSSIETLERYEDAFYSSTGKWLVLVDDSLIFTYSLPLKTPATTPFYHYNMGNEMRVATGADDSLIAIADKNILWDIRLFPIAKAPILKEFNDLALGKYPGLAFHPNGKWLAITTDTAVLQFNVETGEQQTLPFPASDVPLGKVAYDPTGRWLFVLAGANHNHLPRGISVYVYDLASEASAPEPVAVAGGGVRFQVLRDGLVIGTEYNNLKLLSWNGETWEPTAQWGVTYP